MSKKIFQLPEPVSVSEFLPSKKILRVVVEEALDDMLEVWLDDGSGLTSYANQFPEGTVFIACERPVFVTRGKG